MFQSSVDPTQVSLTVTSMGNAVAGFITFLGMVGIVDPAIAGQAWGNFVAAVITAIPAGYAVWHTGQFVWGIMRKATVRIVSMFSKSAPAIPQT